jgi:hypothetical protein
MLIKGVIPAWQEVHSDFSNYFASAKLVQTHSNLDSLYNDKWFYRQAVKLDAPEAAKFSPFPPLTAFVMLPLTFFNIETANRLWIVINLLLFIPAILIIRKMTLWDWPLTLLFILASGLSLANNIKFGQIYWLMTIAVLYSFYWTDKKKDYLSGIALGVVTAIKYFSIVFVAGQFFAKNYRTIGFAVLTMILLFVFQFYFFGQQVMKDYLSLALLPHLNGHLSSQNSFAFEFQSWESFLSNLFGDPATSTFLSANSAAAKGIIKWVVNIVFISPLIFIFVRYKESLKMIAINRSIYFSLPSLAALALLPASATYHFILLIIPIAILWSDSFLTRRESAIIAALYLCIGFIPYHFCFELGKAVFLPLAYPRLWIMTLLYFFVVYSVIQHLKNQPIYSDES